jgi:aspartate racemase
MTVSSALRIGIVGCSAEGAALCYRTLCGEAAALMGEHDHPEVALHTYPLARYMPPIRKGDWRAVAELMLASSRKLAEIGAELAICPDNTIHQAYEHVVERSPIPWLHIVDSVIAEARARGFSKLGVLGTRYLMTGPVYAARLRAAGLGHAIPDADDRDRIDDVIFRELVYGRFEPQSRRFFAQVTERLAARGCDAVVLGCTEIPLLVGDDSDWPLATLDSTRLLARAALREALRPKSGSAVRAAALVSARY